MDMSGNLYIFIEGDDDERFFSNIIIPLLKSKYSHVETIQYAEDPPKQTRKYLKTVKDSGDQYIFSTDLDPDNCLKLRKDKTVEKYAISRENVIIICREIESWYLSGLKHCDCQQIGISKYYSMTDDISKECCEKMIPKGMSRIEFFKQVVERYDVETGKSKNLSLRYFFRKWITANNSTE
jgi:hypothetical protein